MRKIRLIQIDTVNEDTSDSKEKTNIYVQQLNYALFSQ